MMGNGGMMAGMCPMAVPGTAVATSDTAGGVAMTFTTATGEVPELRTRVHKMSEMHNRASTMQMGARHDDVGMSGSTDSTKSGECGGMGMSGGTMMPPATASVNDVNDGARLVLTATDPAQLQALREHAGACSNRMQQGECGMMGHQHDAAPSDGEHKSHHAPP